MDEDDPSAWTLLSFLGGIDLARSVRDRLALPEGDGAFEFAKTELVPTLEALARSEPQKLIACLLEPVREAVVGLQAQDVATAVELSDKFTSANELAFAPPATFDAGIDGFIGPPLMRKGSDKLRAILKALLGRTAEGPTHLGQMELEHCESPDSMIKFPAQNNKVIVMPWAQWHFVVEEAGSGYHPGTRCAKTKSAPIYGARVAYEGKTVTLSKRAHDKLVEKVADGKMTEAQLVDEVGLTSEELHGGTVVEPPTGATDPNDDGTYGIPGRVRKPLAEHWMEAEKRNAQLAALNCSQLSVEEVVGTTLYTSPMYLKYNPVLRFHSGVKFLQDECVKYKLGRWADATQTKFEWTLSPTRYATTIHTINSMVIKLSKLTVAAPVFRGVAGMRLPKTFFKKDKYGISGGCDYGFMSTTGDRAVAEQYAKVTNPDVISTIIMAMMGMVDRGADISFLSQFPNEGEILFGPLTALEVRLSRVSGSWIIVEAKLSVNLKVRA